MNSSVRRLESSLAEMVIKATTPKSKSKPKAVDGPAPYRRVVDAKLESLAEDFARIAKESGIAYAWRVQWYKGWLAGPPDHPDLYVVSAQGLIYELPNDDPRRLYPAEIIRRYLQERYEVVIIP